MHVHGADLNPNATNLYSAVAEEKAADAKQAAEVRKKLLSGASEIEADAEAQAIVGGENEEGSTPDHNQPDPSASSKEAAKKKDAAEEDSSGDPISIWG
jgi:hypothetical protein